MSEILCEAVASGERFTLYMGDCVEVLAQLPDDSVDFAVYSPPFANLYIYSESSRDMGNVADDEEFQACYAEVARQLFRVIRPGRLVSIHVKDLVYYSNSSERGDRGLIDFTGACIRTHIRAGWTYHRHVTVPRCPVREMTKTKADRLLFKNFRLDAARSGGGMSEFVITFRKWAPGMDDIVPVLHLPGDWPLWAGEGEQFVTRRGDHVGLPDYATLSLDQQRRDPRYAEALDIWQNWAGSVWEGLDETDVLNVHQSKDANAEKHLCPMPLNIIERCIRLWSNPGDTVLSPFAGIGSEGHVAVRADRRFIGVELNPAYFRQAVKNLEFAEASRGTLFEGVAAE